MKQILDAFWRAAAYCLHPRVIALSLVPLVLMVAIAGVFGYFFWDSTITTVNAWLLSSDWLSRGIGWLEGMGFGGLKAAIAPLFVILAATPLVVIGSLLFVAFLMTPAMVSLVAERRFDKLERKKGAGIFASVMWSFGAVVMAVIALLASIPLWLIPPLILIVPPLIWGWLTYRVMAFDALAEHASAEERREVMKRHRMQLLGMGVVAGYLGAAPTLLWASGVMFVVFAPIFIVAAIWVYTLVFAFSSLWFAHFCMDALDRIRKEDISKPKPMVAGIESAQSAPDLIVNRTPAPDNTITDVSPKKLP
ncbi:EI24 domain-containing protein [Variovorax sp. PCZ-1]|uniref:EI24 domain-containing protein n=1 Tax=Variovorax sp. PCZ-1 TaxID=2835533 RepID=UPI001BCECF74|nr:EI24 domain-containing protein [Variovorax sp. PCZ-1]MBS7807404.1 EI24 domain-containing protein [Variovorax sp. PCZ-1]